MTIKSSCLLRKKWHWYSVFNTKCVLFSSIFEAVAVQKLPAGFGEKVEIVFNQTGDMISLASEVFNNTGLLFSNFRSYLGSDSPVLHSLFAQLFKTNQVNSHSFSFFFVFFFFFLFQWELLCSHCKWRKKECWLGSTVISELFLS